MKNLHRYIFSICYDTEITDEILQALFVKIWEDRDELQTVMAIKPYLYRCAKNRLLNHLQRKRTESKVMEVITGNAPVFDRVTEDGMAYSEYYSLAMNAIEMLPEKRKQIFRLRMDQDLSLDDIATHLQISKSVVKKQLYSAITFVKKYLYENAEIMISLLILLDM